MDPDWSDRAFWDDGEWVTWGEIDEQIRHKEWRARYPAADLSVVSIFETLISAAQDYHELTGRHLQVYGDIGELFGVITHGLRLHRNYAQGSDGRIGDDLVEVKTITPFKGSACVTLNLARNFSKVLVVRINRDFEVAGAPRGATGPAQGQGRAAAAGLGRPRSIGNDAIELSTHRLGI